MGFKFEPDCSVATPEGAKSSHYFFGEGNDPHYAVVIENTQLPGEAGGEPYRSVHVFRDADELPVPAPARCRENGAAVLRCTAEARTVDHYRV